MSKMSKVTFKPDLSQEEQMRQHILVESWLASWSTLSKYGTGLEERFPVDLPLERFVKWFPEIVQNEFARWRKQNLDTSDLRAGTSWRCFSVNDGDDGNRGDELWLQIPTEVRLSISDSPEDIRTFIFLGELWSGDHLHGIALGPVISLTALAGGSGKDIRVHLQCADQASEEPVIEGYFWAIREMLDGNLRNASRVLSEMDAPVIPRAAGVLGPTAGAGGKMFYSRQEPAGRPRFDVDEWARTQVHSLNRSREEVYTEWVKRGGERVSILTDRKDSFNHMIRRPPKSPPMKK